MSRNKDQLTELNHQINQCRQQSGSNLQVRWCKTFRSCPPVRSDGPHMGTARPSVTDCAWRLGPTPACQCLRQSGRHPSAHTPSEWCLPATPAPRLHKRRRRHPRRGGSSALLVPSTARLHCSSPALLVRAHRSFSLSLARAPAVSRAVTSSAAASAAVACAAALVLSAAVVSTFVDGTTIRLRPHDVRGAGAVLARLCRGSRVAAVVVGVASSVIGLLGGTTVSLIYY